MPNIWKNCGIRKHKGPSYLTSTRVDFAKVCGQGLQRSSLQDALLSGRCTTVGKQVYLPIPSIYVYVGSGHQNGERWLYKRCTTVPSLSVTSGNQLDCCWTASESTCTVYVHPHFCGLKLDSPLTNGVIIACC